MKITGNKETIAAFENACIESTGYKRTIREWLKTIEDKDKRARALNNTWDVSFTKTEKAEDLKEAIRKAFAWGGTSEGFNYWSDFYNSL